MLGCWGFPEVPERYGPPLLRLPRPPADAYTAFLLRVDRRARAERAVAWARRLRDVRPACPLGLVFGSSSCVRQALLNASFPWTLSLAEEECADGFPPDPVIDELLEKTVPLLILRAWEQLYGSVEDARSTLTELAAAAARGRTVARATRDMGIGRRTLYRLLESWGYPPPDVCFAKLGCWRTTYAWREGCTPAKRGDCVDGTLQRQWTRRSSDLETLAYRSSDPSPDRPPTGTNQEWWGRRRPAYLSSPSGCSSSG
jgi:hypothetical protein